MPYIYTDDGAPEAREYESNYYYFDQNDPASMEQAARRLRSRDGDAPEQLPLYTYTGGGKTEACSEESFLCRQACRWFSWTCGLLGWRSRRKH